MSAIGDDFNHGVRRRADQRLFDFPSSGVRSTNGKHRHFQLLSSESTMRLRCSRDRPVIGTNLCHPVRFGIFAIIGIEFQVPDRSRLNCLETKPEVKRLPFVSEDLGDDYRSPTQCVQGGCKPMHIGKQSIKIIILNVA